MDANPFTETPPTGELTGDKVAGNPTPSPPSQNTAQCPPHDPNAAAENHQAAAGTCPGEAQEHAPEEADFPDFFADAVEYFRNFTEPSLASTAWNFLAPPARLRIDMPPAEFLCAVESELSNKRLLELGLLVREGDEIRPANVFRGDGPLYLECDAGTKTIRIQHEHDGLFPIATTALDRALERRAADSSREMQTLLVVSTVDDVKILNKLGIAAVSVEGLSELRHGDVQKLFPDGAATDTAWRYLLVLLDFQLAQLDN